MLSRLRADLELLLHDWLDIERLLRNDRYADHSWETISQLLEATERVAGEQIAPFNRQIDVHEPRLADDRVVVDESAHTAWAAISDLGVLAAAEDNDAGGLQLPHVADAAVGALLAAASIGITPRELTSANAALIVAHGTETQRVVFAANQFSGRWTGTMCLSEPHAGSSLADITTRAHRDDDGASDPLGARYRIVGSKMWISGGDHDLTENIVHLVLAKVRDPATSQGVRGISLFVVPKVVVDVDGRLLEPNDVAVVGLNHKLGYRGLPNTALSFGSGKHRPLRLEGAVGYLVGDEGDGLRQMFHMMNAFRLKVGLNAAALGYAGYATSLEYAKVRLQGRRRTAQGVDSSSPQVPIITHPDVRRMLLAQKAYSEGALALCLYCSRLLDESKALGGDHAARAALLLDTLIPIAKSWPSEWCLEANNLAIQVLGGAGYTRDFPVEQYWRDNRLNMIHEGTHGIQAIDLLGRKVRAGDGAGFTVVEQAITETIVRAAAVPELAASAGELRLALEASTSATTAAWSSDDPEIALVNATPYMQAVGHVVVAWMWLDLAAALVGGADPAAKGKLAAMRYFFAYELPKVYAWLDVVRAQVMLCAEIDEAWL